MTFREASNEAERRLGRPEKEILALNALADEQVPESIAVGNRQIPVGKEEAAIAACGIAMNSNGFAAALASVFLDRMIEESRAQLN